MKRETLYNRTYNKLERFELFSRSIHNYDLYGKSSFRIFLSQNLDNEFIAMPRNYSFDSYFQTFLEI